MENYIYREAEIYKKKSQALVVGLDEAGRGPLFGPVAVGAVLWPKEFFSGFYLKSHPVKSRDFASSLVPPHLYEIRDSKKLKSSQREHCYKLIQSEALFAEVVMINNRSIDAINISKATELGFIYLVKRLHRLGFYNLHLLVDGNYKLKLLRLKFPFIPVESIVKGDSKIFSIASASIVAKVRRDALIKKMSLCFPHYKLERNMGYPTQLHRQALKQWGGTPWHRKSYTW